MDQKSHKLTSWYGKYSPLFCREFYMFYTFPVVGNGISEPSTVVTSLKFTWRARGCFLTNPINFWGENHWPNGFAPIFGHHYHLDCISLQYVRVSFLSNKILETSFVRTPAILNTTNNSLKNDHYTQHKWPPHCYHLGQTWVPRREFYCWHLL